MAAIVGAIWSMLNADATDYNWTKSASITFDGFPPTFTQATVVLTEVTGLTNNPGDPPGDVFTCITSVTTENQDGSTADQSIYPGTAVIAFDSAVSVTCQLGCVNGAGTGWATVLFWG